MICLPHEPSQIKERHIVRTTGGENRSLVPKLCQLADYTPTCAASVPEENEIEIELGRNIIPGGRVSHNDPE